MKDRIYCIQSASQFLFRLTNIQKPEIHCTFGPIMIVSGPLNAATSAQISQSLLTSLPKRDVNFEAKPLAIFVPSCATEANPVAIFPV